MTAMSDLQTVDAEFKRLDKAVEEAAPRLTELRAERDRLRGQRASLLVEVRVGAGDSKALDKVKDNLARVEDEIRDLELLAEGIKAAKEQLRREEMALRLAHAELAIPGLYSELASCVQEYMAHREGLRHVLKRYRETYTKALNAWRATQTYRPALGIVPGQKGHKEIGSPPELQTGRPEVMITEGMIRGEQSWG